MKVFRVLGAKWQNSPEVRLGMVCTVKAVLRCKGRDGEKKLLRRAQTYPGIRE